MTSSIRFFSLHTKHHIRDEGPLQAEQKERLVEVVSPLQSEEVTDSRKVKEQRAAFDHYRGVEQGDFSEDERLRDHIHRISRYHFGPGSRCIKACETATGELLGAAVWVLPGDKGSDDHRSNRCCRR